MAEYWQGIHAGADARQGQLEGTLNTA